MLSLTAEPCLTKLDAVAGSAISLAGFSALMLGFTKISRRACWVQVVGFIIASPIRFIDCTLFGPCYMAQTDWVITVGVYGLPQTNVDTPSRVDTQSDKRGLDGPVPLCMID